MKEKDKEKWEAMFQGRRDSREICVTFPGTKEIATHSADDFARNHGMELLFMQRAGDDREFFGGVYA